MTENTPSDALVERLREYPCDYCGSDNAESADRIEALEAENKRLRYHLEGTLDTLQDAEVCFADCVPCTAVRAELERNADE